MSEHRKCPKCGARRIEAKGTPKGLVSYACGSYKNPEVNGLLESEKCMARQLPLLRTRLEQVEAENERLRTALTTDHVCRVCNDYLERDRDVCGICYDTLEEQIEALKTENAAMRDVVEKQADLLQRAAETVKSEACGRCPYESECAESSAHCPAQCMIEETAAALKGGDGE
jgi:hypothetical protein